MKAQNIPPDFNRVAAIYRWAEYAALGPFLQRTRTHFIPSLAGRKRAYVLGDGDGRFLSALLSANRQLRATAVDTSERMLALARARCAHAQHRLETVHASAMTSVAPPETDLVVTHFFLDCLQQKEVEALARNIAQQCKPGTMWLVSDFQVPARGFMRPLASAYIRLLYLAFRLLTGLHVQRLPDTRTALVRAGFVQTMYHQTMAGMLYTEMWELGEAKINPLEANISPVTEPEENSAEAEQKSGRPAERFAGDAAPDPEPAAPSLPAPDPGVFHHQPGERRAGPPKAGPESA